MVVFIALRMVYRLLLKVIHGETTLIALNCQTLTRIVFTPILMLLLLLDLYYRSTFERYCNDFIRKSWLVKNAILCLPWVLSWHDVMLGCIDCDVVYVLQIWWCLRYFWLLIGFWITRLPLHDFFDWANLTHYEFFTVEGGGSWASWTSILILDFCAFCITLLLQVQFRKQIGCLWFVKAFVETLMAIFGDLCILILVRVKHFWQVLSSKAYRTHFRLFLQLDRACLLGNMYAGRWNWLISIVFIVLLRMRGQSNKWSKRVWSGVRWCLIFADRLFLHYNNALFSTFNLKYVISAFYHRLLLINNWISKALIFSILANFWGLLKGI